jgi:hypothetical protein
MRREELIELSDLNYAEANRELSRRAGGTVLDADDLLLFAGGHPLPVLCNAVMRTGAAETGAQAAEFSTVMTEAYASLGMPEDVAPAIIRLPVLVAPHIVSVLARLEGGAAAAGAMCIFTHGVAGVYWVGTTPAARGHGLAELCTRAVGNAGFDMGARIASLQASVMGEPVYRRMGYVEVTRYPALVRFTPPPAT